MVSNWSRRPKIVRWSDHLHFFDPQHSLRGKVWTYLGLETSFQTLECRRIGEFIEMHFRVLILWLVNHAFLRISSFCKRGRIPSWKLPCKSRCCTAKFWEFLSNSFARAASLPAFRDTGSHCADARPHEFPKNAADGSFGACRSSTAFPDIPVEFRVPGCRHKSRLSIPWGLGIRVGWLETWDNPELLAVQGS